MERDGLDILREKERGEEAQYFRRKDQELIQKLREKAHVDELGRRLGEKLKVEDPALLDRIIAQGITQETGPAFLLAPLVQIAWAEGNVTPEERDEILKIARQRGIEDGSPSHAQLLEWLAKRPSNALFEASEMSIKLGLSVLPPTERDARIREIVSQCRRVAAASGRRGLAWLLGLSDSVSQQEEIVLAAITAKLTL